MPQFDLSAYTTVNERISQFWQKYPDGRILTHIIEYAADHVVIKAEVYTSAEDQRPVSSDYAEEVRAERGVNSTSMVENCSTSAIGRALATLGIAISKNRASREEMQKVDRLSQSHTDPYVSDQVRGPSNDMRASEKQIAFIRAIARQARIDDAELEEWCQEMFGCTVDTVGRRSASELIDRLRQRKEEVS